MRFVKSAIGGGVILAGVGGLYGWGWWAAKQEIAKYTGCLNSEFEHGLKAAANASIVSGSIKYSDTLHDFIADLTAEGSSTTVEYGQIDKAQIKIAMRGQVIRAEVAIDSNGNHSTADASMDLGSNIPDGYTAISYQNLNGPDGDTKALPIARDVYKNAMTARGVCNLPALLLPPDRKVLPQPLPKSAP